MLSTANEDVKPDISEPQDGRILIIIKNADGFETQFRVKPTTTIEKMISAYSGKLNLDPTQLKILFDGEQINRESTIEAVGLTNGDQLDVVSTMTGGSSNGHY